MVLDPNDVFPWIKTTPNRELVQRFRDKCLGRLRALQQSPAGLKPGEYVQPTDETAPGGPQAQPLTGPSPAPVLGASLEALAQANSRREEAQKGSVRGPAPEPEQVSVGPVSEGQRSHAEESREQFLAARAEADARTVAVGNPGEGEGGPKPNPPKQGARAQGGPKGESRPKKARGGKAVKGQRPTEKAGAKKE